MVLLVLVAGWVASSGAVIDGSNAKAVVEQNKKGKEREAWEEE